MLHEVPTHHAMTVRQALWNLLIGEQKNTRILKAPAREYEPLRAHCDSPLPQRAGFSFSHMRARSIHTHASHRRVGIERNVGRANDLIAIYGTEARWWAEL